MRAQMNVSSRMSTLDGEGPAPALWAALAAGVGLVVTGALALLVPAAHAGDAGALQGFVDLNRPRVEPLADLAAHRVDDVPSAMATLAPLGTALYRRQPRHHPGLA